MSVYRTWWWYGNKMHLNSDTLHAPNIYVADTKSEYFKSICTTRKEDLLYRPNMDFIKSKRDSRNDGM